MIKKTLCLFPVALIFILITSCSQEHKPIANGANSAAKIKPGKPNEFGINESLYLVKRGKVKWGETFSDLLLKFNLPYKKILEIADSVKPEFDLKKIRRGDKFFAYLKNDSLKKFVLQPDVVNYLKIELDSTIKVSRVKKKIELRERWSAGVIKNSLYETLKEEGLSPQLAIKLSEIFAWQIDFYRLRKGDSFKAIYNEMLVDGKLVGIGKVKAAMFNHEGEKYFAFLFNSGGKENYFDENGRGLQKTFLKAPVKFSRITSRYTLRRYHPILHRIKAHLGTDYAAPYGTPIMATGDGVVIEARYSRYNGNYVKIRHNSVYSTQYLHMSRFAKGIKPGVRVKQGQVIGYVGATGLATGPHVCYRFWKNGRQVNHLKLKLPSIASVEKNKMKEFNKIKERYLELLNSILLSDELDIVID